MNTYLVEYHGDRKHIAAIIIADSDNEAINNFLTYYYNEIDGKVICEEVKDYKEVIWNEW